MKRIKTSTAEVILVAALLLVGGYHEYLSCLFSAAIALALLWQGRKNGGLTYAADPVSRAVLVLVLALGVGTLWAVDKGMAFIGFLKFLPLLLFDLLLQQSDHREEILDHLPWVAGALTVYSVAASFIPGTEGIFTVAGRMAGPFQYPNSFAAFLLIAEVLLVARDGLNWYHWLLAALLAGGVFYTGSRTAFLVAILVNLLVFLTGKGKKRKWILIAALAAVTSGLFCYARFSGADNALTRLFSLSFKESTFVGRVLYVYDALPLILRHPFGMGYMGFYYIQQSVQTGVYSVVFAHCDPVQILLDAGWAPFALCVWAAVHFFRSKATSRGEKLAGLALLLHCCFDFDLQYLSLGFLLLILCPKRESKKPVTLFRGAAGRGVTACLLAAGTLYAAAALALPRFGAKEAGAALYPWNTPNEIALLSEETDLDRAVKIADHILTYNGTVEIARAAKAREAYAAGDFAEVIRIKKQIFAAAPFAYEEYEEYCYWLIRGISLYRQAGDETSASYCLKELIAVPELLNALPDRLSEPGRRITDQPRTELPEDVMDYIARAKGEQGTSAPGS